MRNGVKFTIAALVLSLPLALLPMLGEDRGARAASDEEQVYEQLDLLMRVFQRIRSEYVDDVNDREVIEAAIQGMLKSLDPHSTYMNKDVYKQVRVQMEGEYGGLGIEVQMEEGLVKVVSPIDDTPADKAGIKGGDLITHIDDEPVMGQTLTEAVRKMRGPVGDPINITVVREGVEKAFDVEIVRDNIRVRSVRHRVEEDSVGYIRITTFNMQTGEGVEQAISELKEELGAGLDGVVLDLRNNPGGLLNEAIRVSDAFLDRGEIVSTRGRRDQNNNRWYATAGDLLDGLPVVVLVNAYSASASEIVAGALQDHRRAVVIGDRTFGKGTVQSEIRLGREGDKAIRLTTARYYTPSGQSIQEWGVEPDIEVLFPGQKANRIKPRREADLRGHITNEESRPDRAGEYDTPARTKTGPEDAADAPANDDDGARDDGARKDGGDDEAPNPSGAPGQDENRVDVQLRHAVHLLKKMNSLPEAQVAEAARANEGE